MRNRLSIFGCILTLSLATFASGASARGAEKTGSPAAANSGKYDAARAIVADIQKVVTPNGVDETRIVTLGGTRQVINIRGSDRANPILIYVHGGPGSVEMPMAWSFQHPWEDFFTVFQWDQRGAGRSYPLNDPDAIADTLRLERYRDDAIELIDLLRREYGQAKVFVLGHSFGSAVGLSVASERPDLLYAYIGMGQLIDFRENERIGIRNTLQEAIRRGDQEAIDGLSRIAPYPDAGPFTIEKADEWRTFANRYGSLAGLRDNADSYFESTRLSPLYEEKDREDWFRGSAFTVTHLWPRLPQSFVVHLSRP